MWEPLSIYLLFQNDVLKSSESLDISSEAKDDVVVTLNHGYFNKKVKVSSFSLILVV